MNDYDDKIKNTVNNSPAAEQQKADTYINSNATTHQYGIGLNRADSPILQEQASAPNAGIEFNQDENGLVVGTAIPDSSYNTSYVKDTEGSELYFNPNVYGSMPWPKQKEFEQNALMQQAQAYYAVGANRQPEGYVGYTPLPREGTLSWWSHLVGNVQDTAMQLPETTVKAVVGGLGAVGYTLNSIIRYIPSLISDEGSAYKDTMFGRWMDYFVKDTQAMDRNIDEMLNTVDNALEPVENLMAQTYEADLSDNSLKANLGRAFGSGLTMLGLGVGINSPALSAAIFNLSSVNTMRKNALNAGVSPDWARAYAVAGGAALTALDTVEIMGNMGALSLTYKSSKDFVNGLRKRGLMHYLGHEALEMGIEGGVETTQETIEGWYNPEFWEHPYDTLFVAGVTGAALRGLGVPGSIRHAKLSDQMALAEKYGVTAQYKALLDSATKTVDDMIAKGVVDPSRREEVLRAIISGAPDTLIETLRLATKGSLEAVPEKNRREYAQTLKAIQQNFESGVFAPETIKRLDSETELALSGIKNGLSNSEIQMIKGVVRGAYVLSAMANANNPNYKGFTVPTFVVAKNKSGYSYYNPSKNEIGIHESRSNTEYSNNSPDYAARLDSSFVPASRQSDKIASILHEMAHWVDAMVGEKGFGDFLEHYYNNIALAFGKDKARSLYNAREVKGTTKGRPTEYFAQTIARLGKRSAEAFGLGKSQANRFLSYANIMLNQLGALKGKNGEALSSSIAEFQTALQNVTKANMGHLADIIDKYGTDNIKQALYNFNRDGEGYGDFAEYLASKDMLKELFDVMDSFADAAGIEKINYLFDGDQKAMDNFVTMGDKMFREGYDEAVDEVRQRRAEAKKTAPKPVEAKSDQNLVLTALGLVDSSTTDSSQVHEDGVQYERGVGYRGTSDENESPDVMKNKYSAYGAGIYYTNDKEQAKFYWFKRAWDEGKIKVEMEVMTKDGSITKKFDITDDKDYNADFEEIVEGAGPQEERRLFFDDWFDLLEDDGSVKTIYPRPVRTAIENLRDKIAYDMGVKPEDILYMSTNVKGDFGKIVKSLLPDDEHMLNEEINLADQSEYVRNAMEKIRPLYEDMVRAYRPDAYDWFMKAFESDGQDIVYRLANIFDAYREATGDFRNSPEKAATQLLSRVGIEGLRLHDGNTIVFTPEALDKIEEYTDRHEIENLEVSGGIQYETQDWAKAALAKDSVKQSFEAGKQEKKQIAADTKIDGRNLTEDIDMVNQGLVQRLKQPMNKFVKWASSSPWGWGLDRILVTVIGRDAAEKLDIAGKYAAKQNIRARYWDEFMNRLNPLFGDPKTNTEFMYKYKTLVTNLGFTRMTGVEMIDPANPAITSTRDITGWEAMYVYLMKEQGFGDRVQLSTTTNIKDIISTLSDDEKAFALHMSDQLMAMYEKTFGKSKYAHYFPILDAEHELFDELSIDSLIARQSTDDAIAITDAGRIFSQYISRWASHESNYFQTMKRARDIFRYTGVDKSEMGPMYVYDLEQDNARKRASAQVASEVRQAIGDDGYKNLMNLIESELQDGQEQMFDASRNKTLTQMGNNIIRSILSNKIVSFPKNAANTFMFWGGAKDKGHYWNSFAEGIGNFRDTYKYMIEHSPEIKQRWSSAGGINEHLDQRTLGGSTAPVMKNIAKVFAKMDWTGDKTQNMAKFSAVMEMLGDAGLKVFMQSGDMIANVYGGYALVKDYMAQGMSEAEAFKKLDRYIIEHQSSSNLAMKPLVQKLQNKSLLGQVFAFTSEGVAKWASILGTFDEVKMGTATKSEAIANVVSIAISMALYSMLAAGVWDLLDDDEKVQEETVKALGNTLLDQVFGGLVAGNAFITPVISYLVGDSRVSGMSVPIYNFALDGISALKKGEYDRVLTKAMSALGVPVGADNAWTTLLGVSLLDDPNPDVRYAGRLMLAGYTPSRSAKRAGIKKESLEKNDEE